MKKARPADVTNPPSDAMRLPPRLLADNLFLLCRLGREARHHILQVLDAWQITQRQYDVLCLIEEISNLSQKQLVQRLGIDGGNMVAIIDGLEAKGWVQRTRDKSDRRRYNIDITADGKSKLLLMREAITTLTTSFFAALTMEEQETLHALMTQLFTKEFMQKPF